MNLKGKYLIVWIGDEAAKLFLGLTGERPQSRWAVWGRFEDSDEYWLWMSIDEINERRPPQGRTVKHFHWRVNPQKCSINWNWVITIQIADKEPRSAEGIGFTPHTAKN